MGERASVTPRQLVLAAESRFNEAGLVFGHGTDNARDEAVWLVFHALGLAFDVADSVLDRPVDAAQRAAVDTIVNARIESRRPAAYLVGHTWFAGHMFAVDERVLVPRSPIAELIVDGFRPWLEPEQVYRVLEIGTGSGCIAIATAMAVRNATVVATDLSGAALAVARSNLTRFPEVAGRVSFIEADLFPAGNHRYDLIVTNPPYVPRAIVDELPPEYAWEPEMALVAGADGLALVRRICELAPRHLTDSGALLVDVGEMAAAVDQAIPTVNFTWLELNHGGEGIGIAYRRDFAAE